MSGKIALLHPLLPAGRVLLSWARPGWGRLGAVSASRRHRPTKGRQIHVLRAAVGFSCASGRAAVPEQRKDAEHASALEADGPQRSRPVALRNPADWNRRGRVVNPGRRLGLRRCRSRAWARRPRSHLPPFPGAAPGADPVRRYALRRWQPAVRTCVISSRERCREERCPEEGCADRIGTGPRPGPGPSWTRRW
jgi:hypothetical protein